MKKKINLKFKKIPGFLSGILVGGLIFGGIGVVAVTLDATQIKFSPSNQNFGVTNANEALNKLYDIANNTQEIVYLGTGTSFNVTAYSGYNGFTSDNFIVGIQQIGSSGYLNAYVGLSGGGTGWVRSYPPALTVTKSYNASTGVLSVSPATAQISYQSDKMNIQPGGVQTYTYFAYLVY